MSRPETLRAHATYLRTRAAVLKHGDDEARQHACDLELEADEIEHLLSVRQPDDCDEVAS